MNKVNRVRLDALLLERGLAPTIGKARALIMAGNVIVEDSVVDKAGSPVLPEAAIRLKGGDNPYVSRGGLKLKAALENFLIDVSGITVLDVGASTGGFTDCLLQAGAAKVYAMDVGYGQLAWKLREDKRVVVIERTNVRYFNGSVIGDRVTLATIDTSFISLKLVIPAVLKLIVSDASLLALIKPQFEVDRSEVGKHGLVSDPDQHRLVIEGIARFCGENQLEVIGTCESPLLGPAGNREFFIYARRVRED